MTDAFLKDNCPCGSQLLCENCCGPYLMGLKTAPTPLALMRSRYSAYTLGKIDYIGNTMLKEAKKNFSEEETAKWNQGVHWQGLTIINEKQKTPVLGFVSFEARYTVQDTPQAIIEKSEFHKINDRWFYVGGKPLNPNKKW